MPNNAKEKNWPFPAIAKKDLLPRRRKTENSKKSLMISPRSVIY